jgi:hypothetical protein
VVWRIMTLEYKEMAPLMTGGATNVRENYPRICPELP